MTDDQPSPPRKPTPEATPQDEQAARAARYLDLWEANVSHFAKTAPVTGQTPE